MPEMEKYTNDIKQLCIAYNVKRLYVFGSVLTKDFCTNSDVDFIVDFENVDVNRYADNYYDFKFSLEKVFQRSVDLLEEKAIKNPYFLDAVNNKRQLVYG